MRYRLRTLLIVTTAVAIWLGYHVRWMVQRKSAVQWIDSQAVYWDDVPVQQGASPGDAPLRLRMLGAPGIKMISVMARKHEQNQKLQELERLFPEAEIRVMTTGTGYHGKHAGE